MSITTIRAGRTVTAVAMLATAGLLLAGCTGGDEEPTPTGTSQSASSTPSASASDQSQAVIDQAAKQQPATSVAGTLSTAAAFTEDIKATVPATLGVYSVRTSAAGTVLDWEISATSPAGAMTLWTPGFATGKVRLFDPQGKKFYEVVSPPGGGHALMSRFPYKIGPVPSRLSGEYPPLPKTVTTIEVVAPNFAKAAIPVTG